MSSGVTESEARAMALQGVVEISRGIDFAKYTPPSAPTSGPWSAGSLEKTASATAGSSIAPAIPGIPPLL